MAWLAFGTTTHELRDGDVSVGSGPEAAWRVSTADLMPRHFVVSMDGTNATLRSHSTDNVVVVNGTQLDQTGHSLRDGDVVLAGSGRFVFSSAPPASAPAAEVSAQHGYLVDSHAKLAHPLMSRSTPIGRDASNAIVVRDPTASRFHAEVRREAGGFALHSIGATGTSLNGQTLSIPSMLTEGDTVEIAFTKLTFTTRPPGTGFTMATPHSTQNEEYARRPTLGDGAQQPALVDEDNEAGRDARRVQVFAVLLVALVYAIVWWFRRSGT